MTKSTRHPVTRTPSLLDRAIVASVAAMLALNVIVLVDQLRPAVQLAASSAPVSAILA